MHINVDHQDRHAILHLRGEFDTFYVKAFQDEVESLAQGGIHCAVLNLRLVKFINSTALGAIIKASKTLTAGGGRLVISRPSPFCRGIIEKVGLDRVVPIYDSDEEAAVKLLEGTATPQASGERKEATDESAVLFSPTDPARVEHYLTETRRFKSEAVNPLHGHEFGKNWSGVGRMASLDEQGLRFTWSGGDTGLDPFAMGQLLAMGTELKVKFRLPLFQKGYCEATAEVSELEEREHGVKVGCAFSRMNDSIREAVKQYAADLRFLKDELREATDS